MKGGTPPPVSFSFLTRFWLASESRFPVPGVCVITKATYFIYWKECHVLFLSIQPNVLAVVKVPNTHFISALASVFSPVYRLLFQFSLFLLALALPWLYFLKLYMSWGAYLPLQFMNNHLHPSSSVRLQPLI